MLETAIVGGGLCGLALANTLPERARGFALFEARERLGGRILSVPCPVSGQDIDLGPAWFWPDTQPRITQLVADLGLTSFPQHDHGPVLSLTDPNARPATMALDSIHGGARRLEGGMAALVRALARRLPAGNVHPGHILTALSDQGDHVALRFRHGAEEHQVRARRVVLALPPRLLAQGVAFAPSLEAPLLEVMAATPTWMAAQAKAAMGYRQAFWRAAGVTGNAFAHHGQVVMGEVFDACDAAGKRAALVGFLALPPALRQTFRAGLPMLVASQMAQLFGAEAQDGAFHFQDWASEPYTCATLDLASPAHHPTYGDPLLRRPHWGGKLHFGSTETAGYGGGYLEGALEAAGRIRRELHQGQALATSA